MKTSLFLASFLLAASAFAQAPKPGPGDSFTVPVTVPQGINSATYAAPRFSWIDRALKNANTARQQADKIQLIFDGDSITDGWCGRNGQEIWQERYAKYNAFDFGIAGDRTEHLLWRLEQGQVDGLHPKLIALMIGTNNTSTNQPEEIAEGIKAIVAEYRKRCPDAVILLQAVFPRTEKATSPVRAQVKAINEIISKLDDGKKVIYVDFGDKFLEPDGTLTKEVMPDLLHPSKKGYQIWADAIQPYIDRYLAPTK